MAKNLYIHIPFCRKKCAYCDFYSLAYSSAAAEKYVQTLTEQISSLEDKFATVYIGGGTPTVLDALFLRRLLKALRHKLAKGYEFSVEANPESLSPGKARMLRDGGVNRLSIGLQSLDDAGLKVLGRVHAACRGMAAVETAVKAGFKNISVDLIFGIPGQTLAGWKGQLMRAAGLPVSHISAYALTCEKGTPLAKAVAAGRVSLPDEAQSAAMYLAAMDFLPGRGFKQYEVSNFALPGKACRHNLNYWDNGEYVGLGPSAVSYLGGVRMRNRATPADCAKVAFREKLTPMRRAKETAALKIRCNQGIDFTWFAQAAGFDFLELQEKALPGLLSRGLVCYNKSGKAIQLTRKGFLFCDEVSAEFL